MAQFWPALGGLRHLERRVLRRFVRLKRVPAFGAGFVRATAWSEVWDGEEELNCCSRT